MTMPPGPLRAGHHYDATVTGPVIMESRESDSELLTLAPARRRHGGLSDRPQC